MTDFRKIGCEDGRWMALLQNHVQRQEFSASATSQVVIQQQ